MRCGDESTRYALAFAAFDAVPATQLVTRLPAATGRAAKVLRVGAAWPANQPLEVALEGELAAGARGFVRDGHAFVAFDRLARTAHPQMLRVTLRHAASGLASPPFYLALRPTALHSLRSLAVAAGLLGCALLLATVIALALPARRAAPAPAKPAESSAQKAIEDWNRSFVAASLSSIKTGDDSFSTVGSGVADAHVSMRSNFGLFFSPTVELVELPADFAVSV